MGTQERIKYSRSSGVDFGPVDPVKYAEAFGDTGLRIDGPDQITSTLRKAFDAPGPVLVGVHVDYRQNAKLFEQIYAGSIWQTANSGASLMSPHSVNGSAGKSRWNFALHVAPENCRLWRSF